MQYRKPNARKTDCPYDWYENAWSEGVDACLAGKHLFADNPYSGNPYRRECWKNWLTGFLNAAKTQ